jgi:hypothetical protein
MSGNILGLIELLAVFGIVFFFGFRELWLLKKDREKRAAQDTAKSEVENGNEIHKDEERQG